MAQLSRIDTLAHTNAWAGRHLLDKALLAGGLLLATIVLPPLPAAPIIFVVAVAAALYGARVSAADFFAIVRLPMSFVMFGAIATAASLHLSPSVSFSLGGWPQAVPLVARGLAGAAALGLFAVLVPVPELLARLRRLGVPAVVCELALLMYRIIAVMLGQMRSSRLSQVQRHGYDGFRNSVRSASLLIAGTASRTMHRAERLTAGLASRGFEGDLPMLATGSVRSTLFELMSAAALAAIATVSVLARVFS
jgi:cobalt/nickel transport system permease protein